MGEWVGRWEGGGEGGRGREGGQEKRKEEASRQGLLTALFPDLLHFLLFVDTQKWESDKVLRP